ncbi:MAG: hypothetical protein NTX64_12510, partial [Elusimicrobia bacterium]|nr:hypothetical protein [Elusimicrobiota bacterium]
LLPEGTPMTEPRPDHRRETAVALILLVIFGIAAGAAWRRWMTGTGPVAQAPAAGAVFPGAALSDRSATLWARLLAALGLPAGKRLSFDQLSEILVGHRDEPLARAFAADFMREPELKAVWDEFRNSREALDASRLADRLRDSGAFARLLNRYGEEPAFGRLGDTVAREMTAKALPAMDSITLHQEGSARSAAQTSRARQDFAPPAAAAPPAARRAIVTHAAPRDGEAEGDVSSAPASEAGPGAATSLDAKRRFEKLAAAGNTADFNAIASLFTKMDKGSRDRIVANLDAKGNVWMACFRAGEKRVCENALKTCAQDPECAPAIPRIPPEPPDPYLNAGSAGPSGGGGRSGCPGPNCDQCDPNATEGACGQFNIDHPGDAHGTMITPNGTSDSSQGNSSYDSPPDKIDTGPSNRVQTGPSPGQKERDEGDKDDDGPRNKGR